MQITVIFQPKLITRLNQIEVTKLKLAILPFMIRLNQIEVTKLKLAILPFMVRLKQI